MQPGQRGGLMTQRQRLFLQSNFQLIEHVIGAIGQQFRFVIGRGDLQYVLDGQHAHGDQGHADHDNQNHQMGA